MLQEFACPLVGAPVRPNMLNMPKSASDGTCFLHAEVHLPGNKLRYVDFQAGERVRSRSFDGPALGTVSRTQPHLIVRDLHHFAVVDRLQSRQPQETDASFSFD